MWNRKQQREDAASIVEEAEKHVNYRAQPNRVSAFQLRAYLGKPWNGTFVDRVLHDALGDFAEVRFISTVSALGYYVKRNRVYQKPRTGSIAFFNFASDPASAFEHPHVGVVVRVNADGSFETVEGETSPGTPQGSQLADGVFRRVRYTAETIGFVRPVPRKIALSGENGEPTRLKMSYFDSNAKTIAKAVSLVQRAVNAARPNYSFHEGKRDRLFKAQFGTYARETGEVQNRGELTVTALSTLTDETGAYTLEP